MVRKPTIPRERLPALQKSYDQLCTWLNFDDDTGPKLARRLLDGRYIKPFFREYRRDFLEFSASASGGGGVARVECADLYNWCISTNAFALSKYAGPEAQVNKKDWAPVDHATRFVVRVLRFSWENDGEWDTGVFDPAQDDSGEGELEFYQVWAILQYLQAEWEATHLDDWDRGGEPLTGIFTEATMASRL